MIDYKIIASGSDGNAVIINEHILIDCGVPFKALKPYYKEFKLVLLTHIHGDHFNKTCIRALGRNRPTLRFGCGPWLAGALVDCGIAKENIDILKFDKRYLYGICDVIPVALSHNVPNQGYKIHFPTGKSYKKMIYTTDTSNLNGITARHYDLYMIEANHEEEAIKQKIKDKHMNGEYAYEAMAMINHLSKEKADDFIYKNISSRGTYVYLHQSKEADYDGNS